MTKIQKYCEEHSLQLVPSGKFRDTFDVVNGNTEKVCSITIDTKRSLYHLYGVSGIGMGHEHSQTKLIESMDRYIRHQQKKERILI